MRKSQDQVNEKSVAIIIKGGKITAKTLAKALAYLLKQGKKQIHKAKAPKVGKSKQSVKSLVRQGQGVSNIEITDANIGSFEPIAKKYGIDFSLKKDTTETPPKWLEFFTSVIDTLKVLAIALGAGLGAWRVINLLEGYGNDNPGANGQGA